MRETGSHTRHSPPWYPWAPEPRSFLQWRRSQTQDPVQRESNFPKKQMCIRDNYCVPQSTLSAPGHSNATKMGWNLKGKSVLRIKQFTMYWGRITLMALLLIPPPVINNTLWALTTLQALLWALYPNCPIHSSSRKLWQNMAGCIGQWAGETSWAGRGRAAGWGPATGESSNPRGQLACQPQKSQRFAWLHPIWPDPGKAAEACNAFQREAQMHQKGQAGPEAAEGCQSPGMLPDHHQARFLKHLQTHGKSAKSFRAESGPPKRYMPGMDAIPKACTFSWVRVDVSLWTMAHFQWSLQRLSPELLNGQGSWEASSLPPWEDSKARWEFPRTL